MSAATLITGGCRSGKSRFALARADRYSRRAFVATAIAFDDEMTERISRHRTERGAAYQTIEAPYDLAAAVSALPARTQVAVIDCLTVWIGNLMHRHAKVADPYPEIAAFLQVVESPPCDLIVVTNEVGLGVVPDNSLARHFRDVAGSVNQDVARRADHVVLMVCGCPVWVKGEPLS